MEQGQDESRARSRGGSSWKGNKGALDHKNKLAENLIDAMEEESWKLRLILPGELLMKGGRLNPGGKAGRK